jgi:hypothetical protein
MPELDSTVVTILTAMEDRFGFSVDDDRRNCFETLGT